jgi:hypothetical protein
VRAAARLGSGLLLPLAAIAAAGDPPCIVAPFQGATTAQGASTQMRVVNTGATCRIVNFGKPAERGNPASSGSITAAPAHGSADFVAPEARYTPTPGYVGVDAFAYEAFAAGSQDGQPLRLKVRVQVQVVAP